MLGHLHPSFAILDQLLGQRAAGASRAGYIHRDGYCGPRVKESSRELQGATRVVSRAIG